MAEEEVVGQNRLKRLTRYRMADTGEKYTAARRALLSDPALLAAAVSADHARLRRRRYPFTPRDGLDGHHALSAWETSRRAH